MTVYPNPITDAASVVFDNPDNLPFTFLMTDLAGRVVKKIDRVNGSKLVIYRKNLPAGLYFVELIGSTRMTGKVVMK